MRHRGFIGSFGTSALLVVAAGAMLLVVSAIVAFNGWPGPSPEDPAQTIVIGEDRRAATRAPDLVTRLAPTRADARSERKEASTAVRAASFAPEPSFAEAPLTAAPVTGAPGAPAAAPSTSVPPQAPSSPPPGGSGATPGPVDDGLAPVTDTVGGVIDDSTDSIGETIDALGGSLQR